MSEHSTVNRYPVEASRPQHDRRARLVDAAIVAVSISGLSFWAGHDLGWERRDDVAQSTTAAHTVQRCPISNPDQDVVEHTWSHRGQVFHRECLIVNKPVYVSPRYQAQAPRASM